MSPEPTACREVEAYDPLKPIPAVCFIDDLAYHLRTSRRTIEKLRRHHALKIEEMPSIDKRARWSGDKVREFINRPKAQPARGWGEGKKRRA